MKSEQTTFLKYSNVKHTDSDKMKKVRNDLTNNLCLKMIKVLSETVQESTTSFIIYIPTDSGPLTH